eukprot:scaffold2252_cov126-Chaetoceros_neogracile.AAC.1
MDQCKGQGLSSQSSSSSLFYLLSSKSKTTRRGRGEVGKAGLAGGGKHPHVARLLMADGLCREETTHGGPQALDTITLWSVMPPNG